MPNGGITPDCVHCKFYQGQPNTEGEPFCTHHQIRLAYPIRAFCAGFEDLVEGEDWLDQQLNREALDQSMMYVWLGGYEIPFFFVSLISIDEYQHWTHEKFLDAIGTLHDQHKFDDQS